MTNVKSEKDRRVKISARVAPCTAKFLEEHAARLRKRKRRGNTATAIDSCVSYAEYAHESGVDIIEFK